MYTIVIMHAYTYMYMHACTCTYQMSKNGRLYSVCVCVLGKLVGEEDLSHFTDADRKQSWRGGVSVMAGEVTKHYEKSLKKVMFIG